MEEYLASESQMNAEVDSKETFFRFAVDAIATSGFGLELNTFEEPNSTFVKQVKEIQRAPGTESGSPWELFKIIFAATVPFIKKFIDVPNFPRMGCRFLKNIIIDVLLAHDRPGQLLQNAAFRTRKSAVKGFLLFGAEQPLEE